MVDLLSAVLLLEYYIVRLVTIWSLTAVYCFIILHVIMFINYASIAAAKPYLFSITQPGLTSFVNPALLVALCLLYMKYAFDITEYDGELRTWHVCNICHVTVKAHFMSDLRCRCKYKLNDNLIVLKY